MSARQTVRDRWVAAVLASDLNNSTKVVLWALSRSMTEEGRAKRRRDDLADDCGQLNPRRISDRIKEARDAGFLVAAAGGSNGQVVQYFAQLPSGPKPSTRVPATGTLNPQPGCGLRGPSNRDPETGVSGGSGSPPQGPIRARVLKNHRSNTPAPGVERVTREHSETSRAGTYMEWLPTPVISPSSLGRGEVA